MAAAVAAAGAAEEGAAGPPEGSASALPSEPAAEAPSRDLEYYRLKLLPFSAAELAALTAEWLQPEVCQSTRESTTRGGTTRVISCRKLCPPRARRHHPRLWPRLEALQTAVAAAAAGAGSSEAENVADAAPGGACTAGGAAAELLWLLRCLRRQAQHAAERLPSFLVDGGRDGGSTDCGAPGGGMDDGDVEELPPLEERKPEFFVDAALEAHGCAIVCCVEPRGVGPALASLPKRERL
jgi:hypothetical protein